MPANKLYKNKIIGQSKKLWPLSLYYTVTLAMLIALSLLSLAIGVAEFDLKLLSLSRFPRTAACLLTGASMAVAGVIMQILVRNRLVEPSTTGTTEAAMLGLLIATIINPSLPIWLKMIFASATALLGMGGFLWLIRALPLQKPLMIPLVGIIYSGIIGAAATFIAFQADLLQYLGVWMTGEFSGILAGRYELLWLAGGLVLLSFFVADQFTVAGLGRSAALSLGLNYKQVLILGIITVAMVTALVVVTVGMLPFVGLVVPNIVSRLMGDNLRRSLGIVAGMGAGLVLLSDILGRVIIFPYEIPAGTIFGVLGAVIFLWLLLKGGRSHA